jgi:hypothetical protein
MLRRPRARREHGRAWARAARVGLARKKTDGREADGRPPDLQRTRTQNARALVLGHVRRRDAVFDGDRVPHLAVLWPVDVDNIRALRALLALLTLLTLAVSQHVQLLGILVKLSSALASRTKTT